MTRTDSLKVDADTIKSLFEAQQRRQYEIANTTAKERIKKLDKLHKAVLKYRPEIREAMRRDFRKHPAEVDLTEIYPIVSEIKHAKRNLRRWMGPQRVATPMSLMGSSSWIKYEPKGVCLIISPWNFPVQLTFGPLVSAVAAGNTAILKPSEHTPHASAIMKKMVEEVFDKKEVVLLEGGVELAQALLQLPFNHIFFTGAPEIGKVVMAAAAKHLSSVTLELGGKSPTIIDETADLKAAATRIALGKFVNNGQICIAPDYIFVHESKKDEFMARIGEKLRDFYSENASDSTDYGRMVNHRHYQRVKTYVERAVSKGARVVVGGQTNDQENFIEPTVLADVPMDSDLMQKEIFGPVLPVNAFRHIQDPIDLINSKEKPLALYIYSKNKKNIRHILNNTRAGGTCINNNDVHFYNNHLPFGGSNNSGIGKSHGWFGFEAFSNARAVYKQHLPGALELLTPPYNNFKMKLIDLTIKWF